MPILRAFTEFPIARYTALVQIDHDEVKASLTLLVIEWEALNAIHSRSSEANIARFAWRLAGRRSALALSNPTRG